MSSSNYPPPQPGQNPYSQQPPQGVPAAPQQPYAPSPYVTPPQGGAAPGGFNAAAYAPPAPIGAAPAGNPGLGVLAGIAAALVAAVLYGLLIKGTKHEISFAAIGVGVLVGLALAKVGGRNPALPFIGVPLALLGVYLGQIFGLALVGADAFDVSVTSMLTDHYSLLQHVWKDQMGGKEIFFFAIAGLEGFVITRRVAG